jgi:ABC-type branched-subunit amino acid transport system substrate-binding protein
VTALIGRRGIRVAGVAGLLVILIAALCGVSPGSRNGIFGGDAPAAAAGGSGRCSGTPIKLTEIATLTGAEAFPSVSRDYVDGTNAAVKAVNSACTAGRPLDVIVCDDQSDPNQSTTCGTEAKEDGSLAIFNTLGSYDNGVTASGLPAVLTQGASQFDLTSPDAYPASSALVLVLGSVAAAAAAGAKTYLMVAFESPVTQFLIGEASTLAKQLGVTMTPLYFPADTTDFAPVAAQVAAAKPGSIGLIVTSAVPFINALAGQGISPKNVPIFTAVSLIPPDVIHQVGNKIDGAYLISQSVPAQQTSNPGIRRMLKEYAAAGIHVKVADIGTAAVAAWSNVHIVGDALSKLSRSEIKHLTSAGLVKALQALGPVSRPEMAPFNLSKNAFPTNPVLKTLRIFSSQAMVVRVENGTYEQVSPFGPVTKPFKLDIKH